jgi:predicted PurR-regulated permease PerM
MTAAAGLGRRAAPWGWVLLAVLLFALLYRVSDLVLVAFVAILAAMYLSGVTDLLCARLRTPRPLGLTLAALGTIAALAGIGALLAPAVATQTGDLIAAAPQYLSAIDRMIRRLAESSEVLRGTGIASAETGILTSAMRAAVEWLQRSIFGAAAATGVLVIDGVAVVAMAFYLAWRPSLYVNGVLAMVPPRHRPVARAIAADLGATLRAWVGAQLLAMVLLAVATGIGLWLLDVPYWLAFAIFTGVAVMVPFFGSITSTLLPALLVLPDRGLLAFLAVAAVGVVVHVIEANFVHPIIMHHRIQLPPALTILSVLAMAALAGLLGMVVAVPTLAVFVVLVRHVLIYQTYGEAPAAGVAGNAAAAAEAQPG